MTRHHHRRAAGFTLVELLIALALLGLLSLAIFGSLRYGTRVWAGATRVDEQAETVGAVQALLRLKLASAYPMLTAPGDPARHVDFDGARDALEVVTFLPERDAPGVTATLRLRAAPAAEGGPLRLVATWRPLLTTGSLPAGMTDTRAGAGDPPAAVDSVLLAPIAALRFSYYGVPEDRTAPEWQDAWSNRRDLPLLVSVTVSFPDGDRRLWPELIVALRTRADVTCVFDPLIRDCRQR